MPNIRPWKIVGDNVQCPYCKRLFDGSNINCREHECEDLTNILDTEAELETLIVYGVKELGEIAECLVKNEYMFDHWQNELGDLCVVVKQMLDLAKLSFEDAVEIGLKRKSEKINGDMKNKNCV